ncbi:ornithine carbamoyltransferase [Savitreella phatthalungensis]
MTSLFKNVARHFSSSGVVAGVVPSATAGAGQEVAIFANGCFWGTEQLFKKHFAGKGLLSAEVGYIGGKTDNPSYRQVCGGDTDHAESLKVVFDPSQVSYERLTKFHYAMHDPTTLNQQGNDRGTQYRSAIFYLSDEQKEVAERVTKEVQDKHFKGQSITTQIADGRQFKWFTAEGYHQQYLDNNPSGYHCPAHYVRFDYKQ